MAWLMEKYDRRRHRWCSLSCQFGICLHNLVFADSIVQHGVKCCHTSDVAEAANASYIDAVIDAAFSKECVN